MLNFFLNRTINCLKRRFRKKKIYFFFKNSLFKLNIFFKKSSRFIWRLLKYLYKVITIFLKIYLILWFHILIIIQIVNYYNLNQSILELVNYFWTTFNWLLKQFFTILYKIIIKSSYFIYITFYQLYTIFLLVLMFFKNEFIPAVYEVILFFYEKITLFIIFFLLKPISFLISLIKSILYNNTRELLDHWFDFSNKEIKILLFFKNSKNEFVYTYIGVILASICSWFLFQTIEFLTDSGFLVKYTIIRLQLIQGFLIFYLNFWIVITITHHDDFVLSCIGGVAVRGVWHQIIFYNIFKARRNALGLSSLWLWFSLVMLLVNFIRFVFITYILKRYIIEVVSFREDDPAILAYFRYIYCSNNSRIVILSTILIMYVLLLRFYQKEGILSLLNVWYAMWRLHENYKLFYKFYKHKSSVFLLKIKSFLLCEDEIDPNNPYLPVLYKKIN